MAYSPEILEVTPERSTRLLSGIGAVATIRTLLAEAGMTDEAIIEGRDLLLECIAAPRGITAAVDTDGARAQRASVAELDQWDEPGFGRFSATLKRHHPSAGTYVFANLSASTGVAAVHGVATFLTRIDALEGGTDPDRQGTKKDDKKAVELLRRARKKASIRRAGGPGIRTAAPLHATVFLVAREQAAGRTAPPRAHDAKHVEPGSVRSVTWESDV